MLKLSDYKLIDKNRNAGTFAEVVERFNDTVTAYPSDKTVHALFRDTARLYPSHIAVEWQDDDGCPQQMTYAELDRLSDRWAALLTAAGVGHEQIVPVLLEPSGHLIAVVLGILKSGGAYIALNTDVPFLRKKFTLDDTAANVIITAAIFEEEVKKLQQACSAIKTVLFADRLPADDGATPPVTDTPRSLAYVCYTSGTTGNPKGVLIEHRSVVRLVRNTNYIDIHPGDKISQTAPLSFDASTFEIWGALLNGACLFIIRKEDLLVPAKFTQIMQAQHITIAWFTASLFNRLFDEAPEAFLSLRKLLVGGDVLSPSHISQIRKRYPGLQVINGYGPTENTTFSACFLVDKEYTTSIPIGKPVSNSRCYILNKSLEPVPVGITGELYVAGDGLARGYLHAPELTAEKFIGNPFRQGEKMYRTGDLAKWLPDGNIRFIGREDDQVKINGYRIETGEIENKIAELGCVKQVVVTIRQDERGEKYLCAYFVAATDIDAPSLKNSLSAHLPDYMLPAYFVSMEALPLNANGKTDRQALPDPRYITHHTAATAPRNQLQQALTDIWKGVLGYENIGIDDNFFSIGGHSLKATQIISRVEKELGLKIGIRDFFTHPTVAAQSRLLEERKTQQIQNIGNTVGQDHYDLSFSQRRLWVLDQFAEGRVAYNIPAAFRVKGLRPATLEMAFRTLIARHESLRTVFVTEDDMPGQKILQDPGDFQLTCKDFRNEADAMALIEKEIRDAAAEPFDLAVWPLLRANVWQTGEDEHVLFVSIHHIISDAWSLKIIVSELHALYTAYSYGRENPLAPLQIQYRDYVAWMRQQLAAKSANLHKLYWYHQLAGELPVLELPTDFVRPAVKTSNGDYMIRKLNSALAAEVQQYAQEREVSLFMMLITALKVLFGRYTGQEDILVGTHIAGRGHADLETLVGFFVNTLPVRTRFSLAASFDDILGKVRTVLLDLYENQVYPLDELIDELKLRRDLSRNPLFDVLVGFQNTGLENSLHNLDGDLRIEPYPVSFVATKADLDIMFEASGNDISIRLEYNTDIFRRERLERLLDHYVTLLESVMKQGNVPAWQLELVPAAGKQLLANFSTGPVPEWPPVTLCGLTEQLAAEKPQQTAVICGQQTFTYRQLEDVATTYACNLISQYGVRPGDMVGVVMERSEKLVAVLLGILKTGAAYVPIDPAYPAARITYILSDAAVKLVVSDTAPDLPEGVLQLPVTALAAAAPITSPVKLPEVKPDYLAYVIYTSGTTGQPKGVMITHAAVINFLFSMQQQPGIGPDDLLLAVTSCAFDISVLELFLPLITGATVLVATREELAEPSLLMSLMEERLPTIMQATPSMWRNLRESGWSGDSRLKVLCGGESMPYELGKWLLLHTGALWNMYGPTETTIWSIIKHIRTVDDLGSIGTPIAHTGAYILDGYHQPVPPGIEGELCIAGRGLSRGYLNKEALTQQKFVWNETLQAIIYKTGDQAIRMENGEIRFIGRKDNQVKLHGYRIEPEEIETVLLQFPGITNAAVGITGEEASRSLTAYIVGASPAHAGELRQHLAVQLPAFMVPHHFVFVDALPTTSNGKLDRAALLHMSGQMEDNLGTVPPDGEIEEKLLEKWQRILNAPAIGVTDNFFESGGHSLMATQLVSWMFREFNVKMMLGDVFNHPTIRQQAKLLAAMTTTVYEGIAPVDAADYYELSHAQYRLWVMDQMEGSQVAYNMPGAFDLEGEFREEVFRKTVAALIARHESLRTTFSVIDGIPRQTIHTPENMRVPFAVVDLRKEQYPAQKAAELADEEAERPFDLEKGPLLRITVLQTANDRHMLLFTMHHIISDGWSMGILIKEAQILYNSFYTSSPAQLPALGVQYKDFAAWQHKQLKAAVDEQYWLQKLSGPVELLRLPYDFAPSEVFSFNGQRENTAFDATVTGRLKEIAREHNISLSNVVFTLFNILLFNITGQENITVGVAVANRNHAELENIIGFFVNSLVIQNTIKGDADFRELLQQVSQHMIEALDHQGYPFNMLVEKYCPERINTHQPLFNVFYGFQNFSDINLEAFEGKTVVASETRNTTLNWVQQSFNTSKFDLTLFVLQYPDTLHFMLEYNSDLFTAATVRRYLNYFNRITLAITENY